MNDLQAPRGRWAVWGPLIGLVLFVAVSCSAVRARPTRATR